MRHNLRLLSRWVVAVSTLFAVAPAASGQSTARIAVTDSRPLWGALDALERIVRAPINYEDPPYQNLADVQNSPTLANRPGPPVVVLVPRIGTVLADVPTPGSLPAPEAEIIRDVGILLANYRQAALPGAFTTQQANGMTYVTPVGVLGRDGAMHAVTSAMSVAVTVPYQNRTVGDTLAAIFEAVRTAAGVRTGIGSAPFLPSETVSFGTAGESARDALARLLAQLGGGPYSYRLLYDPLPNGRRRVFDYVINIQRAGYSPAEAPGAIAGAPASAGGMTRPAGARPGFTKTQH